MFYHKIARKYTYRSLILSALILGGSSLVGLPTFAASPTPGDKIENQATGSFVDESDDSIKSLISDNVTLTVAEVAGITVTANGVSGTPNPGATVYYSFVISNAGNDPTQFFIPSAATLTGNGTQLSNIEITSYNLTGTNPVATSVVVPNGGSQTGSSGATTTGGLLNANGIIPPGGSVTVRVPVKINATAANNDPVIVQLGDTPDATSLTTPKAQLENQVYAAGANDVYTIDNPDNLDPALSAGVPINGDATNHRQEAAALQSALVIAGSPLSCTNIYGITSDTTNTLLKAFDPITGTVSTVATMGPAVSAFSLGIDPISKRAYFISNLTGPTKYHIFTYDAVTGLTTDTGAVVGVPNNNNVLQLGFDQTGVGYVIDASFNAWSFTTASTPPVVTSLGVVGGLAGYNGGDIAFDTNNVGWTVSRNTTSGNYALFRVTKTGSTLSATNLGDLNENGVTLTNGSNIGSVAFDSVGNLYIVRSSDGYSWKINPNTLVASTIASSIANNPPGIADFATCAIPIIGPKVSITGNVFHDQDANVAINGTDAGTNAGSSTLTVYAVDPSGKVTDKSTVATNGSYTLSNVPASSTVKLRLSNDNSVAVGGTAPAKSLPTDWFNTGENLNGTIDPVIATLGDIALTTANTNLTNENFGIRQATVIAADPAPATCSVDYRTALNTGVTAAGGQLGVGANDLNWTAEWIAGPSTGVGGPYAPPRPVGPMPAVVTGNLAPGNWVVEPANARWISYPFRLSTNSNGVHRDADLDGIGLEGNTAAAFTGTSDDVRVKFTAKVTLPSNASTIAISLPVGVAIDNQFVSIKVNGVENISPVPTQNPLATDFGTTKSINLTQGWQAGANTIEIIADSSPNQMGFFLAVTATTVQTCGNAKVLLVKRITAINGNRTKNPNDNTSLNTFVDDTTSIYKNDDNSPNWPTTPTPYLLGAIDGGKVKPDDEIEYTIYYLNAGTTNANTVRVCDRILPNQTFKDNAYGTSKDVELGVGTNTLDYLTSATDTVDRTQLYAPTTTVPTNCNLKGSNADGTLVVDLTGATGNPAITTVPAATAPGTPNNSYGFFRFTTKVKP